jgi:hypothetical protein
MAVKSNREGVAVSKIHEPKPGRLAFVCEHKDHDILLRKFVDPDDPVPMCPKHGKMTVQKNAPYNGQQIPVAA